VTSLWRQIVVKALRLLFNLALFLYIVAAIGDQRFMIIDRADITVDTTRQAGLTSLHSNPPLTSEQQQELQTRLEQEAVDRYGFDHPFLLRVHERVVRFFTVGLGQSRGFGVVRRSPDGYRSTVDRSVAAIILNAAVPTILLFFGSFLVQIGIAYYLGLWIARRPGSCLDRATAIAGYLGTSVPPWIAAFMAMILFVYAWRIFPGDIWICRWPTSWGAIPSWTRNFISYYTLPFLTLVLLGFGTWAIQFRNIAVTVYNEDFVAAARARGLPERRIVFGHVARAASPPLVSAMAMGLASSVFGCFLVEAVFHWPGIGWLFWQAVNPEPPRAEDQMIFAIMLVTGVFYIVASFALDLVYRCLDPRIRSTPR
jgi:peptide/nickel transport system permease protein